MLLYVDKTYQKKCLNLHPHTTSWGNHNVAWLAASLVKKFLYLQLYYQSGTFNSITDAIYTRKLFPDIVFLKAIKVSDILKKTSA